MDNRNDLMWQEKTPVEPQNGGACGTPICDFIRAYKEKNTVRMHMPGHKGQALLGPEPWDITEIGGADSLYEADGIIAASEGNAARLFGTARTVYSTEGSSQCIRAMLYLARVWAEKTGRAPRILAARNAHRTFVYGVSLLHLDVDWLPPAAGATYLSCPLPPADEIERLLVEQNPAALYVTSPDYLGHTVDIGLLAELCHRHGTLLLVDNAHGAYLKFLEPSRHPMDLGADICCDSAHKTLPALTGAAYLHFSRHLDPSLTAQAKDAMALFGSTSPSYLIMASLDAVNSYLSAGFREQLAAYLPSVAARKEELSDRGICFLDRTEPRASYAFTEPLKWTLSTKPMGYTGTGYAAELEKRGIVVEFADPDFVVLMLSCIAGTEALDRTAAAISSIPLRSPLPADTPVSLAWPEPVLPIHETLFRPSEIIPAAASEGRILAAVHVACPPAVPIVVSGERITESALSLFRYYGITECEVLKER